VAGSVISFYTANTAGSWFPTVSRVATDDIGVVGVQVNGWNFADTPISTTISSAISSKAFSSASVTSKSASTAVSTNSTTAKSGLPLGAKIGIGVGLPLACILIGCAIAGILLLRRKRPSTVSKETTLLSTHERYELHSAQRPFTALPSTHERHELH